MILVCSSTVVNLLRSVTNVLNAQINADVKDSLPGSSVNALLPQAAMHSKLLLG
jgi:hypothetical protein